MVFGVVGGGRSSIRTTQELSPSLQVHAFQMALSDMPGTLGQALRRQRLKKIPASADLRVHHHSSDVWDKREEK